MAFTNAEKVSIRRHMGFQVFGSSPTQAFGYRYFTRYGTLEFRLNNMDSDEEAVVRSYATMCNTLEQNILQAGANLGTAAASVWTRNAGEQIDRERLYHSWRLKLCAFFGVKGPELEGAGTVSLTV